MSSHHLGEYSPNLSNPFYRGSVQNLHAINGRDDVMISETTAGGSVFDVGTIFHIKGSDTARTGFRHYIFTQLANPNNWHEIAPMIKKEAPFEGDAFEALLDELCTKGANTHHMGMVDPNTWQVYAEEFPEQSSALTLLRNFSINKPTACQLGHINFFDYSSYTKLKDFVVPLEYIVRFGVTSGSSVLMHYESLTGADKSSYAKELGVPEPLKAWMMYTQPRNDFTTKYEPSDRRVSNQEAALISSLTGAQFNESVMLTTLASYVVRQVFARMGLTLWDLKWEMAKNEDELVFVDTIDTDSVRATYALNTKMDGKPYVLQIHFNKQSMRDYYQIQHADWYGALQDAKKRAKEIGQPFTEILSQGQADKRYPQTPVVDETFLQIQQRKFAFVDAFIRGVNVDKQAKTIAQDELNYYIKAGKFQPFAALTTS